MQSNVLTKVLRPHSSTHVLLHLRYTITIILALTRAPHSQLFNKLRSTSIQDKVALLYTSPLSIFSPIYLYFLPLCIRLNLFYLISHSFCSYRFFLSPFWIFLFSFFFFFFFSFFSFYLIIIIFFIIFCPLSLPLSCYLSLFSIYHLLNVFFPYPHRFFLTLVLLFIPSTMPPDGGRAFRGKTKLTETWHEILAGKAMTTYVTVKSSTYSF